jgi:hypothetical protein
MHLDGSKLFGLVAALLVALPVVLPGCTKPASKPSAASGSATPARPGSGSGSAAAKKTPKPPTKKPVVAPGQQLDVGEISFAGPAGHRDDAIFGRGEQVVTLISVKRFIYKDGKGSLRGDVEVRKDDATRQLVLRQRDLKLLEGKAPTKTAGSLRAAAKLSLDPGVPPGAYKVQVTVRDLLSKRRGSAKGRFELHGAKLPTAKALALLSLRNVGDEKLAPGSVLPLSLVVGGIQPTGAAGGGYAFDVPLKLELLDSTGKVVTTRRRKLRRHGLLFAPASYGFAQGFALPTKAEAGRYRLRATLGDGKRQSRKELPLQVVARRFAIVSPHLFDAGRLPRETYRFGEQAFLRLAVQGFSVAKERCKLAVDIAVSGPGGVYFARKNAAQLSGIKSVTWARVGRFPMQLPIQLPKLAPKGAYKVLLRARDLLAKKEVTRELRFRLEGTSPKPLGSFRVDKLYVRRRADLPRIKGDTFIGGRKYHLEVLAGGGKLKPIKRATYRLRIEGALRLRLPTGAVLAQAKKLFKYDRTLNYQPLRASLTATWRAPSNLPRGLYDLEIQLLDPDRNRVSTLRKRIELVPPGARP